MYRFWTPANLIKSEDPDNQVESHCLQTYLANKCSVTLPHGAMGWSVVYDCGISF